MNSLVFAKKLIAPSSAANVLQSFHMVDAFLQNDVMLSFWPGVTPKTSLADLFRSYNLSTKNLSHITPLYGGHKGMYGLTFRARLCQAWLSSPNGTAFLARDIKESLLLSSFKKFFPFKKHHIFYELHEVLYSQHKEQGDPHSDRYFQKERAVLDAASGVITVSPLLIENIKETYGYTKPSIVLPAGFNPQTFSPCPNVDFHGSITLGYIGSLHPGKGVGLLLETLEMLPKRFKALIIGGNPSKELAKLKKRYASLIAEKRLTFMGQLTPSEISSALPSIQTLVIPATARKEYFCPIKLREAYGQGLPIVTTPVPEITESLCSRDDAIIAKATTPEALQEALLYLAEHEELAHKLQERCRAVAPTLTWKNRAKQCLNFMDDVLRDTHA